MRITWTKQFWQLQSLESVHRINFQELGIHAHSCTKDAALGAVFEFRLLLMDTVPCQIWDGTSNLSLRWPLLPNLLESQANNNIVIRIII